MTHSKQIVDCQPRIQTKSCHQITTSNGHPILSPKLRGAELKPQIQHILLLNSHWSTGWQLTDYFIHWSWRTKIVLPSRILWHDVQGIYSWMTLLGILYFFVIDNIFQGVFPGEQCRKVFVQVLWLDTGATHDLTLGSVWWSTGHPEPWGVRRETAEMWVVHWKLAPVSAALHRPAEPVAGQEVTIIKLKK